VRPESRLYGFISLSSELHLSSGPACGQPVSKLWPDGFAQHTVQ
jgi:hypothetical protein